MNQVVWFRNDLRLHDHQALNEALDCARRHNSKCLAVYCISHQQLRSQGTGERKFSAIQTALEALNQDLAKIGIKLTILKVNHWRECAPALQKFCEKHAITRIHTHDEPGYDEWNRDTKVTQLLSDQIELSKYNDLFLVEPNQHLNKQGGVFKVFTAFKKSLLNQMTPDTILPLQRPKGQPAVEASPLPRLAEKTWSNPLNLAITESQATASLDSFLEREQRYQNARDIPCKQGTSGLSVALSIGTLSSRQIAQALTDHGVSLHNSTFFSEILWREFYKYLIFHRPELCLGLAFNERWDAFPWQQDSNKIIRWQRGETGVPIVDAAMRQLNTTGWMHNRLRMISAMYLVKIMQQNWREGEAYFARQLADFDFASNNGGWQWVASTGVDAVPYFRIFNPYQQSRKFDPDGTFLRNYLPELSSFNRKTIHEPELEIADYPPPVVNYSQARQRTLAIFKQL